MNEQKPKPASRRFPMEKNGDEGPVGAVSVDSGTLLLMDPCYIQPGFAERSFELGGDRLNLSYMEVSLEALGNGGKGQLTNDAGSPIGFIASTGRGDGLYPVYAEYEEGRVARLLIDFTSQIDPAEIDSTPIEEIKRRARSSRNVNDEKANP